MKIAPIQFNYSNRNIKFGMELDGDDITETKNSRYCSYSKTLHDSKTHPIWVGIDFHENGKISGIKVKYKNGKYASGTITESYDENGKNINYKV